MQTHEQETELGRWRVTQRAAYPRLRAYVHGYFASSSNLPKPVRERHLPSTEVPLVLNFGAPHRRFDEEASSWAERDGAWVVGLHESRQLSEALGERHFMIVRFTPIGAHLFLGVPMHLLSGRALELHSLDPALSRLVMSRIGRARSWSERFAAIESLIAERILERKPSDPASRAFGRLASCDGRIAMRTLASGAECSDRHLIALFRGSVGLPPKAVARLFRFNRAVRLLNGLSPARAGEPAGKPFIEAGRPEGLRTAVDWADIAAQSGYFDQSHFIKEFRRFAGATPTAFIRQVSDLG